MDKNTVTGLILMVAIFFGFMFLMRPSKEELEARAAAEAAKNARTEQQVRNILPTDSLSPAGESDLAQAIKTLGVAEENETFSLLDEKYNLRAESNHVTGTVKVGNSEISLASLRSASDTTVSGSDRTAALKILSDLTASVQKYHSLAKYLGGKNEVIILENDVVKLSINSLGAMISEVELKKYETEVGRNPGPIQLFQGPKDGYSFQFTTDDQRINTREFNFMTSTEGDSAVVMSLDLDGGARWAVRYSLHPGSYVVGMEIIQQGITQLLPPSTASAEFKWHQTMARNEKGRSFEERNSAIYYKYIGDGPDNLSENKDDTEQLNGRIKWVSFKNQFFSSVIVPREYFTTADLSSFVIKNDEFLKDMDMNATLPYNTADGVVASFDWYLGPNSYPILSKVSKEITPGENLELTRLIPLGWGLFRYINIWIVIPVFTFLSKFITSYGIIILLLTIFIKLILFPFTYKSYMSQARMRVLQPEIKAINEKYPGQENMQKRQQETMALYSQSGASPFSGCLPMLLQMPILIAMFSFFPSAIELRGQSFLWAKDLAAPDYILTLPFTIPWYGNQVSLFCLLMTAVNIIYMRITTQNQPTAEGMPSMKWMMYIMPIMFLFIFNDYASGLSYYYFLSLLITILQTWFIRKFIVDEKKVRAQMLENAKKPRKKGWMQRKLEEAQKQQEAIRRQQQAAQGGSNRHQRRQR